MDSSMEQYLAERKSRIYHARGQKYLQMYMEGRSVLAKLRPTPHELQIEERPFKFYRHGLQIPYTWSLKQNVRLHLSRYLYYLNKSSRTELMETLDALEIMNEAFFAAQYLYERAALSPMLLMNPLLKRTRFYKKLTCLWRLLTE